MINWSMLKISSYLLFKICFIRRIIALWHRLIIFEDLKIISKNILKLSIQPRFLLNLVQKLDLTFDLLTFELFESWPLDLSSIFFDLWHLNFVDLWSFDLFDLWSFKNWSSWFLIFSEVDLRDLWSVWPLIYVTFDLSDLAFTKQHFLQ